jgi:phosphate transport system substrate-binding protein
VKSKALLTLLLGAIATTHLPGCTVNPPAQTQTQQIKVSGSSSAYPVIQELAAGYQSPAAKVSLLPKSQSEASIAGVKTGLFDIAAISRQLTPQEAQGDIQFREIAKDGLLVATHANVKGITNLTTDQLKDIYSGKVTNWKAVGGPDAKIVLLDRPEDESAKRLLRKHYLGADLKNSPEAVVLKQEGELITALQSTPYAIGAFSLAYALSHRLPVNHLRLNTIEPTPDSVANGKYVMVRHLGIISQKTPSPQAQAFINYAFGAESVALLKKQGFVPTSQP